MPKVLFSQIEVQELIICAIKAHHGVNVTAGAVVVKPNGEVEIPMSVADAVAVVFGPDGGPNAMTNSVKAKMTPPPGKFGPLWDDFAIHLFTELPQGPRTRHRKRVFDIFKNAGCRNFTDVLKMTPQAIAKLPSMGEGTWKAIRNYLTMRGYSMPESPAYARTTTDGHCRRAIAQQKAPFPTAATPIPG